MFLQPVEQVLCFRVFQGVKASQAGVERETRATGKGTLHSRVLHVCPRSSEKIPKLSSCLPAPL